MKKSIIILFAYFLCTNMGHAQSKRDWTWLLGNGKYTLGNFNADSGMAMYFTDDTMILKRLTFEHGVVHAVCNDEEGNLLFYYNFCNIGNKNGVTMDNGDNMNVGSWDSIDDCKSTADKNANLRSESIILPIPNHPDLYQLLHMRSVRTFDSLGIPNDNIDRLQYSTIDMSKNNGLGQVVEKDQPFINDSFLNDAISAVRHGNGRDWWVVVPRGIDSEFYVFELTPSGLKAPKIIEIIPPAKRVFPPDFINIALYGAENLVQYEYIAETWYNQARFSPDGTKYARFLGYTGVEIYDFDRCSGAMTFRKLIPVPFLGGEPSDVGGLCFSPNSRYLYYDNTAELFQFDLCEENLNNELYQPIVLDTADGIRCPGASFYLMRNGPDGKIYMNIAGGRKCLHVINRPDLPGLKCDFQQGGIELPEFNNWLWSDFPNFNLYDLSDSPCDTLGIDLTVLPKPKPNVAELTIFPNPANEEVHIYLPGCNSSSSLTVWNVSSIQTKRIPLINSEEELIIDTKNWAAGVYFFKFTSAESSKSTTKKLVVVH